MYHVELIGIISLLFYLITLAGKYRGFISSNAHKSFWNIILLLTFLLTATAGIFLALQNNYKWDIKGVEKLITWHVEFGIGMSFTAIFHLSWHLKYFLKLFKTTNKSQDSHPLTTVSAQLHGDPAILLFLLGFITIIVQIVFLKEIMNISGGYELINGLIFALWLILSSLGAALAGQSGDINIRKLVALIPLLALLPFILLILLYSIFLTPGETPSMGVTSLISLLALAPFTAVSGYLFIKLTATGWNKSGLTPGKSYSIETIGGIVAGLISTLAGGYLLNNYQLLLTGILITIPIACNNLWPDNKIVKPVVIPLTILLVVMSLAFNPDRYIRSLLFRDIKITSSNDSKFGNISTGVYSGEETLYYNHKIIRYANNQIEREENIHYALSQHPDPASVMIISGGLQNHIGEIAKYRSVKEVTYIERDSELLDNELLSDSLYPNISLNIVNDDPYAYIRECNRTFDVIILLIPVPDNFVSNRYFTLDFFSLIKKILEVNGIFALQAPGTNSYISMNEMRSLSTTYNDLGNFFMNIIPIRGEKLYLLASNSPLGFDIASKINDRNIDNSYVNSDYLSETIIRFNSETIIAGIDSLCSGNMLNHPVSVFHNQLYSLSKSGSNRYLIIPVILVLLALPFLKMSKNNRLIYASSMNLAGTEILALLLFQSTIGEIYQSTGLFLAVIMGGLAFGSSGMAKIKKLTPELATVLLVVSSILYGTLTPVLIKTGSQPLIYFITLILIFIPGYITGYIYMVLTTTERPGKTASGIYSSELLGASLGFLAVTGLLVPVIGIKNTFYILAIINFGTYISAKYSGNRRSSKLAKG